MKKFFGFLLMVIAMTLVVSCSKDDKCYIHGSVDSDKYNGVRIFLVPLSDDSKEAVDSVVIQDRKFEFVSKRNEMAKILLDYHYRMGTQQLLVVLEPGDVNVVIGAISSANGTPQNDSLDVWKRATETHNMEMGKLRHEAKQLTDTTKVAALQVLADSIHNNHKRYTRRLAANMKSGVLHDFLKDFYPTSYKKKMPDGTVVTVKDE
ncbi:MAG: DUF4369 domain-containing protein [Prevotella sp.]|nr:DUF4369 domain-containing protein [Prevotella sp.]MCR5151873.1 DUF4369 domain-containing protein [Prevotella sp.]